MLQVRRRLNHGLCLVVCLALALAGCTNYRVSLDPVTLDDPAAGAAASEAAEAGTSGDEPAAPRVPPQPLFLQQELEDPPVAGKPEGWVRLRFAVDARGGVQKVEVLESSELAFEAPAVRLISSWSYTPGIRNTGDSIPIPIPGTVSVFLDARAMLSLEPPHGQARKGGGARGPASRHPAGQPAPRDLL